MRDEKLTNENIDRAADEAVAFLENQKVDRKNVLRFRLNLEDALLRYQDQCGEDAVFTLKCGKRLGKIRIELSVPGDMYDPFTRADSDETDNRFMRTALASMGELPTWGYFMGCNTITIGMPKRHIPDWAHLIIAIVAAIVLGILINAGSDSTRMFVESQLLGPVLDTFMGFLNAMAGPMICLAIIWGIYSIGDASTFSVLGKRLLGRFALMVTFFTLVLGALSAPLYAMESGGSSLNFDFGPLLELVLGVVPNNLFTPFTTGNTLQILFVAVIIGLTMLIIAEKTRVVAALCEQVNTIVQLIMDVISKLVPLFVFGSLLDIIISGELATIADSYKLLLANVAGCAIIAIVSVSLVRAKTGAHIRTFLKKALPTFVIGLTTASSSAAYATNRTTCSDKYGIAPKLADFGVPFGQIIYKPTVALLYLTSAFCAAEMYGVTVSGEWLISGFLMSIILSMATPPIPGGQLASYSVLFAQLGIPSEAIAIVLAMGIILDFLETPTDLLGGQCMLVLAANRFNLLDKDVLRSK